MGTARAEDYVEHYRSLGFDIDGEPCVPADLEELEQEFRVRLPAAYRGYLLLMGRRPNYYFDGTDCALRQLPHLRDGAVALLKACGSAFELPSNAFVFLMHQGYQFMYFLCEEDSPDPAVYYYLENDQAPKRVYEHYSDWMRVCADEKREYDKSAAATLHSQNGNE